MPFFSYFSFKLFSVEILLSLFLISLEFNLPTEGVLISFLPVLFDFYLVLLFLLYRDHASQLRRLGQDHASGRRDPADDRGEARPPGPVLSQPHGRRCVRDVRYRHRDCGALGCRHHHGPSEQRRNGDLPGRLPDGTRAVRRVTHVRRLRPDRLRDGCRGHDRHDARGAEVVARRGAGVERPGPHRSHRRALRHGGPAIPVLNTAHGVRCTRWARATVVHRNPADRGT